MPMTIKTVRTLLDALHYDSRIDGKSRIVFPVPTGRYVDARGRRELRLAVRLVDEVFRLSAPLSYSKEDIEAHRGPFFEACALIQHQTQVVRFEFDLANSVLLAATEIPLEGAELSCAQLGWAIRNFLRSVDLTHSVLTRVIETGTIDLDVSQLSDEEFAAHRLSDLFPPELLETAARLASATRKRTSPPKQASKGALDPG